MFVMTRVLLVVMDRPHGLELCLKPRREVIIGRGERRVSGVSPGGG